MPDRLVSVGDDLTLPADVRVPVESVEGLGVAGRAVLAADDAAALRDAAELGSAATAETTDYASATQGATWGRSRTIILGDSIAIGSDNASLSNVQGSWFSTLAIASGQRMLMYRNAGVAGNTSTQMLARLQPDVIAYAPDVCLFAGPTNDFQVGISSSTTRANYQAVFDALTAAGIAMVVATCPPIDVAGAAPWETVAKRRAGVIAHNMWLREWAGIHRVPVIDLWAALVNPANSGYISGYAADGVHPQYAAMYAAAAQLEPALPAQFTGTTRLAQSIGDATDLFDSAGLFLGTPDASNVPAGWFKSGDGVVALATDPTIRGNSLTISGGVAGLTQMAIPAAVGSPARWASGDIIEIAGNVTRSAGAAIAYIAVRSTQAALNFIHPINGAHQLSGTFVSRAPMPSGTTEIQLLIAVPAGASLTLSQVSVRNLTTLALV